MSDILRSDSFTAGSGPLDSTYTQQMSSGTVNYNGSGSAVASVTDQDVFAFDNLNAYPDDQYSKITVGVVEADRAYNRVTTRASGVGSSNINLYNASSGGTKVDLTEMTAGVETGIQEILATVVGPGDLLELQSVGTTHTVLLNAGIIGTPQEDATHASGSAGLGFFDEAANSVAAIAAWEGGTLELFPVIRGRKLSTQQRMTA